ncbi:MAG: baseplate J/gp47 family protein [Actinomycetota bacterium]|nr:baseplate J/gp47 family protein [Actinomycetota bacterium]
MAFTLPTLTESRDFLIALMKALLPDRDVTRKAFLFKFLTSVAAGVTDLHAHINEDQKDLLPDTASGVALDRWGALVGVTRKGATPARKSAALSITGTLAATVAIGDELTHEPSGLSFQVNEAEAIPAGLTVNVDIVAIDTGSATRLDAGEVLTFVSAPTGINPDAVLVLDLDEGGDDVESDGAYRKRILDRMSTPALGGSQADYVAWATSVTDIAAAYAYPGRAGLGSVDVAALHAGSGSARLLTAGEITDLLAKLEELAPANVELRVLTVEDVEVDTEVTVWPNGEAAYEFDWDDTAALVVSTWTAGTRTIVFTTARPASMRAGDRIVIDPATPYEGAGEQHVIESLSSTNAVVLEEAPSTAPVATDLVYSGGTLVDEVRDAILEHFDELGTSNTDAAAYGSWDANVRPENLYRIAQLTNGVRRSAVVLPAATVEPEDNQYPDDGTVFLATPRITIVRQGH